MRLSLPVIGRFGGDFRLFLLAFSLSLGRVFQLSPLATASVREMGQNSVLRSTVDSERPQPRNLEPNLGWGGVCVMDASFWFFRRYFATVFLLDSPTFAVAVLPKWFCVGCSLFSAEPFTGLSPRGKGARVFPLNWKALPTSKTCVCVRMLESAPGTRPSAQFDCLDLGLAVCRSFRVAAMLRVLVASPSPSLLCTGARDFFDFLCRCLCCPLTRKRHAWETVSKKKIL